MKTLKEYVGKYRVIAYYAFDEKKKKFFFLTSDYGVGEDDWCMPLRVTPRKKDWFDMSRVMIEDNKALVYIANPTTGERIYKELKKVCDILNYEKSDEEANISITCSSLHNSDVMKILKPYKKGSTIMPDSPRNLPDYKLIKDYKLQHPRLKKQLIETLKSKFGKNYKSNIRLVYMRYNEDTGTCIQDLAEESGYLSILDYIDAKNLYKKITEIINKK